MSAIRRRSSLALRSGRSIYSSSDWMVSWILLYFTSDYRSSSYSCCFRILFSCSTSG